jgi:hypothetical protein
MHGLDFGFSYSPLVYSCSTVASLTVKIRNLQYILQNDEIIRRNGGFRKACKEMTDKRKQYLNRLRNLDYKKFEWLIYNLSILYKPTPPP